MSARPIAAAVAGTLVAVAVGLSAGFLYKDRCSTNPWDGAQYRTGCYNDILALYGARGFDREPVPYVDGNGHLDQNEAGDLEYPVGTGLFIAAVALGVDSSVTFFRWSAVGLGIAGALAAVFLVLTAADRRRILLFALAPSLVLYAFLNWDLLAVLAVAVGFWAFAREDELVAGLALGLGAATKLFPGIFVPVLVLARLHERRRVSWRLLGGSVLAFVALNLPIAIANPQGWWFPYDFQSSRFPNYETSWYFVFRHLGTASTFWSDTYPSLTSSLSVGLFVAGSALLLWREWVRDRFRPAVASYGVLMIFLLSAKVYSPQYALWVLPFFVLVHTRWLDVVAFAVADLLVWIAIAAFLLSLSYGAGDRVVRENLLEAAVLARYAVLGVLLWRSRWMEDNIRMPAEAALEAH